MRDARDREAREVIADRPPHVGVLLENTPFFSAMLVAAGMSGIVPVGLNPVRRGAALQRDIDRAEELAQDALVVALAEWPRIGVPANPGAWLMAWTSANPTSRKIAGMPSALASSATVERRGSL